jgi:hypothetical protein
VNVSTNSVPALGVTAKVPGIGLPLIVTMMSAKAEAPVEVIVACSLNVRVDREGIEFDGIRRVSPVEPVAKSHDTGVKAIEGKLTDESFTLHVDVATENGTLTRPCKVSGADGLIFCGRTVTMLTVGPTCVSPIKVTVAVDARVLSETVTVTAEVVPKVVDVESRLIDDEVVAPSIEKLQAEEAVGAVCRQAQL